MAKKIFWLLILLVGVVGCTTAFDIPVYDEYVTDTVGILSQQQEQDLESQIFGFVKETSAQMWILIIPSTQWEDIAMLATDVGNTRWVGEREYNNWLVMVIAIDDRDRFIAVWYGLEGTITDAIARRVGEAYFPDNFRAGDYYAWIQAAVSDLYAYIKKDPTVVRVYQESSAFSWKDFDPELLFFLVFLFAWLIGKFITAPDPTTDKKRKMTPASRAKFGIVGAVVAGILYAVLGTIIGAVLLAYAGVGIITLFAVVWLGSGGIMMMWGRGGSWWFGGGSSFGWFGWGSFGGGGWGGSW